MAELILLLIVCGIAIAEVNTAYLNATEPAVARSKKSNAVEKLLKSNKVTVINSKDILSGKLKKKVKSLAHVKSEVLEKRKILAIDLSDTKGTKEEKKFKEYFLKIFAVYFPAELIVISRHKSELMFTAINDTNHPHFSKSSDGIEDIFLYHEQENGTANKASRRQHQDLGTSNLPVIKFNWKLFKGISESDNVCRGGNSNEHPSYSGKPTHYLCSDSAGIWVIFEVTAYRSLNDDSLASDIVDNKFIRISSTDTNQGGGGGGGFSLNGELRVYNDSFSLNRAYVAERKMSSMFSSEYHVGIEANDRAVLKYSIPNNNVNKEVQYSYESSETIGVQGGLNFGKDAGNANIALEASRTKTETISFTYADFGMIRHPGARFINYTYTRDPNNFPDTSFESIEENMRNVGAIGYAGFIPKFDVAFIADPAETETTTFTISLRVKASFLNLHKIRNRKAPDTNYHFRNNIIDRDFVLTEQMIVEWSHAVFTGYRLVNLQSEYYSQALDIRENGEIYMNEAVNNSISQSFIFTRQGNYESLSKRGFCLDSTNLQTLQHCNSMNLDQRWYWKTVGDPDTLGRYNYTDFVEVQSSQKRLAMDTTNERLVMVNPNNQNDTILTRFFTSAMNVYEQHWLQNVEDDV